MGRTCSQGTSLKKVKPIITGCHTTGKRQLRVLGSARTKGTLAKSAWLNEMLSRRLADIEENGEPGILSAEMA